MNERPTPETDRNALLLANLDDWIDDCLRNSKPIGLTLCDARKRISDQSDRIAELWDAMEIIRRERDEAREALADWENAADHVEANHPDEVHCSCVPVLRKLLADARKERDEAIADRDIARLSALESDRAHDRMVAELEKVYKERDDALSQIVQAECRAERFCQERDEAWACCDELVVDSNAITLAKTVMRLERERDEAREALDRASLYISNHTGSCPYDLFDIEPHDSPCSEVCDKYTNDMQLCWKKHFANKEAAK